MSAAMVETAKAPMTNARKAWIALAALPAPMAALSVCLSTGLLLDGRPTTAGSVVLGVVTVLAMGGFAVAIVRRNDDVVRRIALASIAVGIILGMAFRDATAPALAHLGETWGLVARAPVSTQPF